MVAVLKASVEDLHLSKERQNYNLQNKTTKNVSMSQCPCESVIEIVHDFK